MNMIAQTVVTLLKKVVGPEDPKSAWLGTYARPFTCLQQYRNYEYYANEYVYKDCGFKHLASVINILFKAIFRKKAREIYASAGESVNRSSDFMGWQLVERSLGTIAPLKGVHGH
jgi:hypothetical protein